MVLVLLYTPVPLGVSTSSSRRTLCTSTKTDTSNLPRSSTEVRSGWTV